MGINLSKGQKVDLTKSNPGLVNVTVGLGWDTNKYDGGKDFDLDSSVFLLGSNGKCSTEATLFSIIMQLVVMVLLFIQEIIVLETEMGMMSK